MRTRLRSDIAVSLALALLVSPVRLSAQQGQTATLTGTVTDPSGAALSGVTLTVVSRQLVGGPKQVQSDDNGRYRFISLSPGTYEMSAALPGFKTVRRVGVDLPPGLRIVLDVQLEIAPVSEVVDVVAAMPAIDVGSASSPTLIDRQLLENLPLNRQSPGYAELAPGLIRGVAFGGISGANVFSIEGTLGTDPVSGQVTTVPSPNWLEEVQVVALGGGAQYGEYTGARLNAILRSGGDAFSGLGEYMITRSGWTANNRGVLAPDLALRFRPLELLERWDASAQAGGPIVRNRLWFFAGSTYYKSAQRPASFADVPRTHDEPRALVLQPKYLTKLTGAPAPGLRLEGFIEHHGSTTANSNAGPLVRPEALFTGTRPEWLGNVRLTWTVGNHTQLEGQYGSYWQRPRNGPTPPNTILGPPSHFDRFTNVRSVNVGSFGYNEFRVGSASAALTRYESRASDNAHELKAGVEHEWASELSSQGFPGGIVYLDFNSAPDLARIWAGSTFRGSHRRTSAFGQHRWQASSRITVETGLRATFYDGEVLAPGTPRYRNRSISPRAGVAWSVPADHRATVIRAHYGRYHDPLVTSLYDFLDPLSVTPTVVARVIGPDQFQELTRSVSSSQLAIDPEANHPFVDEYLLGIERDVSRLSVKAQYVRRVFKESLGFVDVSPIWAPMEGIDPGSDGRTGTADDGAAMTVYYRGRPGETRLVATNPAAAWRRYDGLQLIATRRHAAGWETQASYTLSRTRGSFDNDSVCCTNTGGLGTNGNFVNPNRALFSIGRTTLDRRHEVKLLGTYALPYWGGIRLSGIYRYASGTPWARKVDFGPLTELSEGVRVEPIGARELPPTNSADVRIEKTVRYRGRGTGGIYLDVFNVNNQGIPRSVNALSGPNFALPTGWVDPRIVRAGLRVTF